MLRLLLKAKQFTKLDIITAFYKIRIKKGDEQKTAFRTKYGLFKYLVTSFGLIKAPVTFQRYINNTFRKYFDKFVLAYINDVLIYLDEFLFNYREKV